MNVYAIIPLVAVIAYVPLLITTIGNRPWQRRHTLFLLFLISAMTWSLTDVILRGNFYPQYNLELFELVVAAFAITAVQFHCFISSFFPPGRGRWLIFAYVSLAAILVLISQDLVAKSVTAIGDQLDFEYGVGIIAMLAMLLPLGARDFIVLWKMLRSVKSPVQYNQILTLLIGLFVLVFFTLTTFLPVGGEYPISHFGSLIIAFLFSYAIIRHQLVDIKIVLRRGFAWVILCFIGIITYALLFFALSFVFGFEIDLIIVAGATIASILISIFVYRLRGVLFLTVGKALQGRSYGDRRELSRFASKIHNLFSLKEQGGELLGLIMRAIGCNRVGLLFLENISGDYTAQIIEPNRADNPLTQIRIREDSPIVDYLKQKRRVLTREMINIRPEFRSLWDQEHEAINQGKIELFMPLISRDRLIGILILDGRKNGRFSLEEVSLLEDVTNQVAVSMEKEYLREELRLREEEISVLNRSSNILSSSLDIPKIYDRFVNELKRVVDISWAAITLIEKNELHVLALSSEAILTLKRGSVMSLDGTTTQKVAKSGRTLVEFDLSVESKFVMGGNHLNGRDICTIAYLPLTTRGSVIGSFIVASGKRDAYGQRQLNLLEQLASQIALPIENSRLYAKTERQARLDDLTGLFNRRSLDEQIVSEIGRHSRYGDVFSLLILDLDSFKAYNDSHGHLAGDEILKQVGDIMKKAIRSSDMAFRYGGDEFALLLPQTNVESAYKAVERIRKQIAVKMEADSTGITASQGLASWPADGIGSNDIIGASDRALYHAKRSGGNRTYRASGTMLVPDDTVALNRRGEDSKGVSTIFNLAAGVDGKDHYTGNHSRKVEKYTVAMGKALKLDLKEISNLSACAILHDIGKIGVSSEILNKVGKLTDKEREIISRHPQLGASIVSHVSQLAPCIGGILHHHERYDGTGYPQGLKGDKIPLQARILAITDAYAAMTVNRPYAGALPQEQALEEIERCAGTQFDPELVKVFIDVIKAKPILIP